MTPGTACLGEVLLEPLPGSPTGGSQERWFTTDDGQFERSGIEINVQLSASFGPEREISVAREDHQSEALTDRDDLIVRLQIETQFIELSGFERLAVGQRFVVLRIRPTSGNDVARDLFARFIPR